MNTGALSIVPPRRARNALRAFCAATVLVLAAPWAAAGLFSVSPVRIYMTTTDRAVAVTLTNEGTGPVALQADLYSWAQKADGSDDLVLTEDLIVSPPIVRLAPGARQVVRLARLAPPDQARQLTYRLIMREVPEAAAPKAEPGMVLQVPIALAMSMPVFITPAAARAALRCEVATIDSRNFSARCENTGTAYAQVRQLLLPSSAGSAPKAKSHRHASSPVFDDGKSTEFGFQVP